MLQLTQKQKLGVNFALYVFSLIALISIVFLLIFKFALTNQIKKNVLTETNRIISDHIAVVDDRLAFTLGESGEGIREELLKSGFSGLFLDSELDLIKGFGIFSIYRSEDKEGISQIVKTSSQALESQKPVEQLLLWQNQRVFAYFVPLTNEGKVVGMAVLGRPIDEIGVVENTLMLTIGILGAVTLFSSFFLGYILSSKSFSPLHKFAGVIDKIDLERLNEEVLIEGHEKDDLVILARKFNLMVARIKDMSEQQTEFMSNVSHELKTPLTKAISALEVLDPNESDFHQELERIKEDLFEINNLMDKLLLLSKLRKENIRKPGSTNLGLLIEEILENLDEQLRIKSLKPITSVPEGLDIPLPHDYALVLFSNLISNAIKYSFENGKIKICAQETGSKITLSVRDWGIGMPEEEISKAFEQFHRSKEGKRMGSGSGVGLSIVKRIAGLYGLELEIKSVKGEGTEVLVFYSPNL